MSCKRAGYWCVPLNFSPRPASLAPLTCLHLKQLPALQGTKFTQQFDLDGNGLVNFDEFLLFQTLLSIPLDDLEVAFRLMDRGEVGGCRLEWLALLPPALGVFRCLLQASLAPVLGVGCIHGLVGSGLDATSPQPQPQPPTICPTPLPPAHLCACRWQRQSGPGRVLGAAGLAARPGGQALCVHAQVCAHLGVSAVLYCTALQLFWLHQAVLPCIVFVYSELDAHLRGSKWLSQQCARPFPHCCPLPRCCSPKSPNPALPPSPTAAAFLPLLPSSPRMLYCPCSQDLYGLMSHFFGEDGRRQLSAEAFQRFIRDLRAELLRLEFEHYDWQHKVGRGGPLLCCCVLSLSVQLLMCCIGPSLRCILLPVGWLFSTIP